MPTAAAFPPDTLPIYADDAGPAPPTSAEPPARADVAIVGAGFAGLSAALHLARAGRQVVALDARAIADGASGRNGGQLHPGQRRDQQFLVAAVGDAVADRLWRLGEEAIALVHALRAELDAPCDYRPGLIDAAHTARAQRALVAYCEWLNGRHGAPFEVLDRDALAAAIGSTRYVGGVRDPRGGHLNPLAFARAIARGAAAAGATLVPHTKAVGLRTGADGVTLALAGGRTLTAGEVLLAGNGYLAGLHADLDDRVMPLVNHIAVTEPVGELIPGGEAVADTRAVIRYFRQDARGRLVFGGGESFGRGPRDVAAVVRPYIAEVYPQLAHTPIVSAWSGTLGITPNRCPIVRRARPGLYVAAGFSGQGVGLATYAGKVVAHAIAGDTDRLDTFAALNVPRFPLGRRVMGPLAAFAMASFSLKDRLGL